MDLLSTTIEQKVLDRAIARFWTKVRKGDDTTCWIWIAAQHEKGYGVFGIEGDLVKAHRFAYYITHGPIENGLFVLHSCDNPPCCNPKHLFLGTNNDNVQDMVVKGRHIAGGTHCGENGHWVKGTQHHAAILDEHKVRSIRADYASGAYSYSTLAEKYGIGMGTAYKVVNRITWRHVQ